MGSDDDEQGSDSESETEDEDAEMLTPALDLQVGICCLYQYVRGMVYVYIYIYANINRVTIEEIISVTPNLYAARVFIFSPFLSFLFSLVNAVMTALAVTAAVRYPHFSFFQDTEMQNTHITMLAFCTC